MHTTTRKDNNRDVGVIFDQADDVAYIVPSNQATPYQEVVYLVLYAHINDAHTGRLSLYLIGVYEYRKTFFANGLIVQKLFVKFSPHQ